VGQKERQTATTLQRARCSAAAAPMAEAHRPIKFHSIEIYQTLTARSGCAQARSKKTARLPLGAPPSETDDLNTRTDMAKWHFGSLPKSRGQHQDVALYAGHVISIGSIQISWRLLNLAFQRGAPEFTPSKTPRSYVLSLESARMTRARWRTYLRRR